MPRTRRFDIQPRPDYADRYFITNLMQNLKREGHGRSAFLVQPETFELIAEVISSYRGWSREKVLKVVRNAYDNGVWYDDDAGVHRDTVRVWLRRAAEDLGLDLKGRSLTLSTLVTSNKILLSARLRRKKPESIASLNKLDLFII